MSPYTTATGILLKSATGLAIFTLTMLLATHTAHAEDPASPVVKKDYGRFTLKHGTAMKWKRPDNTQEKTVIRPKPPAPKPSMPAPAETQAPADNPDIYTNASAGFAITKPTGWYFLSKMDTDDSMVKIKSPELQQMAQDQIALPSLVSIAQNPAGYNGLNPNVDVKFAPITAASGIPPVDLMSLTLPMFESALEGFSVIQEAKETTIGGHTAARMLYGYSVEYAGKQVNAVSRLLIIPVGGNMFLINMTDAPEAGGNEMANAGVFDEIEGSIKIETKGR